MDTDLARRDIADWRAYLRETRESLRAFGWVWREIMDRRSKRLVSLTLGGMAAASVISSLQPAALGAAIQGLTQRQGDVVIASMAAFVVCKFIREFLHWFYARTRELFVGRVICRIEARMNELFFEKSLGQHLAENGTLSASNVEKGKGKIWEVLSLMSFEAGTVIIELAVALVFLWIFAAVAGGVVMVIFATYCVWMVYLNRKTVVAITPVEADFRAVNRYRADRWEHIERVKTCGKEAVENRFMDDWHTATMNRDARYWLWFINMMLVRDLLNVAVVCALVVYGTWLVWENVWTLALFIPMVNWVGVVADNLWRIGQLEHRLNTALPYVQALMQALTIAPEAVDEPDAAAVDPSLPLRVELRGLSHAYGHENGPAQSAGVLRDVSFSIESGEKVALIGPSGAGKTTIMRLVQRYMNPDGGEVLVNGRPLRATKIASWRSQLAYIPQQAQIFDGTLRENLLYGLPGHDRAKCGDDQLWDLMRLLRIDFGARLMNGLDTRVGRRGMKLSGGEAQRVMIGAAVMRKPRFMIIDEATSSLDSTTEKQVQQGLTAALAPETSALIITHRLSTVRHLCTKFVVLRPAEALAPGEPQTEAVAGSFEELHALSPTFRQLAEDQGIRIVPKRGAASPRCVTATRTPPVS